MSLTKAQKELLETMQDKGYHISHWIHGNTYNLMANGGSIKSIRWDSMRSLLPFFIKTYDNSYKNDIYKVKPDAQISDAWLQAETTRLAQVKADAEKAKQAEKEHLNKLASDYFNANNPGPYQVDFNGQWPFSGSILFNGEPIAQISAVHYSTSDSTFDDMMKRPENKPHFEVIKSMLRLANGGDK